MQDGAVEASVEVPNEPPADDPVDPPSRPTGIILGDCCAYAREPIAVFESLVALRRPKLNTK